MNNYTKQKALGDIGEELFLRIISKENVKVLHRPSADEYFPYYDFLIQRDSQPPKRIEVKTETIDTGNIAIEVQNKGNPSGLSLTQADLYFIYNMKTNEMRFKSTDGIREYIEAARLEPIVCSTETTCYLLPASIFHPMPIPNA